MQVLFGIVTVFAGVVFLFRSRIRKPLELIWQRHNRQDSLDTTLLTSSSSNSNSLDAKFSKAKLLSQSLEAGSYRVIQTLRPTKNSIKNLSSDLNLVGITASRQAWVKVKSALVAAVVASVGGVFLFRLLNIVSDSNWWFLIVAISAGAAGFFFPDKKVRELAEKKRDAIRTALAAYLDLVKILLAGGSHTDGALFQAVAIGRGWAFSKLRSSIDWSRVHGKPVYEGFARLAEETGVAEIQELAAVISLADKEGASLKETLTHKAELLTTKGLSEARAKANALGEKMSMPTVLIAISFMAFIAYPALASLTN